MHSVFKALNYSGEQTITYEQIGRLGAWATDIGTLENLQRLAKNTQEAALHDLPPIRHEREKPARAEVQPVRRTRLVAVLSCPGAGRTPTPGQAGSLTGRPEPF